MPSILSSSSKPEWLRIKSPASSLSGPTESAPLLGHPQEPQRTDRHQRFDKILKRLRYYVPALDWIPQYSPHDLLHDAISGVTLACLLIPQSIGYATQLAGIPGINGLFSAAIPVIIYPLLCTGRHVSVGPEAALGLLVGQVTKQVVQHRQSHSKLKPPTDDELSQLAVSVATLVTFQTGMISFGLGFFRLGFLDAVLSRALLRGFVTAIAVVIGIEQLIPMLGLTHLENSQGISSRGSIEKLVWTLSNLRHAHRLSFLISLVTLAFLVAVRSFKSSKYCEKHLPQLKYLPEILIVAVIASFITDIFNWDRVGVEVVGSIHANQVHFGLPWQVFDKSLFSDTLGTAVTLCICGLVDSIVAAKAESARFHYPISANRELVALGAANIASSFVMGNMPSYGSITRSRLNASTGARTPLASIITGFTIIFAIYFLLDYLFFLPKCVLAVVITLVVYTLFSELPGDLKFFWNLNGWTELAFIAFTFLLTLAFDIRTGILVSAAVSLVLTVKDATRIRVRILGKDSKQQTWEVIDPKKLDSEEIDPEEYQEEIPGVLIVKIRESLSFANVGGLKERLRRLEMFGYQKRHPSDTRERDQTRMIVFHLGDVDKIDPSSLQILKEIFVEYRERGVEVWICHIRKSRFKTFKKAGIVDVVGQDRVAPDINTVLRQAQENSLQPMTPQQIEILLNDRPSGLEHGSGVSSSIVHSKNLKKVGGLVA